MMELMNTSGPYQFPYWSAAQLHNFLHSIPNPQSFTRQLSTFEEYCSGIDPLPQILSKTYTLLNTPLEQPPLLCLHFHFNTKTKIIKFSLK